MARKNFNIKTASFVYDFAVDGGALGANINMGVRPTINAVVVYGAAKVITALTSGGAATISVGHSFDVAAFIPAIAVASWSLGAVIEGVDLIRAMLGSPELQVNILGAALTAGRFVYFYKYIEMDE